MGVPHLWKPPDVLGSYAPYISGSKKHTMMPWCCLEGSADLMLGREPEVLELATVTLVSFFTRLSGLLTLGIIWDQRLKMPAEQQSYPGNTGNCNQSLGTRRLGQSTEECTRHTWKRKHSETPQLIPMRSESKCGSWQIFLSAWTTQIMKAWIGCCSKCFWEPTRIWNTWSSKTLGYQLPIEAAPVPIQRAMFVWLWCPKGFAWGGLCCATAEPFVGEANQNAP